MSTKDEMGFQAISFQVEGLSSLICRMRCNMYLPKGVMVEIKGDGVCKIFSAMSDTWMSVCVVTSDSF